MNPEILKCQGQSIPKIHLQDCQTHMKISHRQKTGQALIQTYQNALWNSRKRVDATPIHSVAGSNVPGCMILDYLLLLYCPHYLDGGK